MTKSVQSFKSQRGVTTIEYALAMAIVFLGVIGFFRSVNTDVEERAIASAAEHNTGPCGDLLSSDECR